MERMRKPPSFTKSVPVPDIDVQTTTSNISKWIPLIFAGAAAGVSIVALNEIKNVRKEIITLKKEQNGNSLNEELNKRMENMEAQLQLLADFVQNKEKITKESNIIRNVVNQSEIPPVHIINGEEYEEVEVTDDEADDLEQDQVEQD